MTTFTTRKTIRDDIAGLFTATGSWSNVYSGMPAYSAIAGDSPVMTIITDGTGTTFNSLNHNPRVHNFLVTNWILYTRTDDSWSYTDAEDKLDALELVVAQTIRDNAAGSGVADLLQFSGTASVIDRIVIQNTRYLRETFTVVATLATGAL